MPVAPSPSSLTPTAVSSQAPSFTPATAGASSVVVGPGRSVPQQGISQRAPPGPAVVRTTVAGQPVGGSTLAGDSQQAKAGAAVGVALQQRPILPATAQTQSINTTGLSMLAAVGARQQQQQLQQQQATASPQPAQVKVYTIVYAIVSYPCI